jgi:hypothetical protein
MRLLFALGVLLVASHAYALPDDDDDPKRAALAAPVASTPLPDEDDPKLSRGAVHRRGLPPITHHVPRVKLSWRRLVAHDLDGNDLTFNAAALDFYPSSGYLRVGVGTEVGFAGGKYDAWYVTAGASLGFQYPARVTPFIEGRFAAGLIGGSLEGQSAVSYIYTGGIETGIELYVGGRFYFSAALGWAHPTYSGVDVAYVQQHPMLDPPHKNFSTDNLTIKLGLGL